MTFDRADVWQPKPGSVSVGLDNGYPCFCNPGFTGTREGDVLRLILNGGPLGSDDTVVAPISEGRDVRYDGQATATLREGTIAGTFNGTISVVESASGLTVAACSAADHGMSFVK